MKSTTVLAALTCLGLVAARTVPSVLPRALAKRSPVQNAEITWNHDPKLTLPLKKDWTDLGRVALDRVGCHKGAILCAPHREPGDLGRNGKHILMDTNDGQGHMQVYQDGSVRYHQTTRPSPMTEGARTTWNSNIGTKVPEHKKEKWEGLIRASTYLAGCHEAEIQCAPRAGYQGEDQRYGKHVEVKTDELGDIQVYKNGSIRFHVPKTVPSRNESVNWGPSSFNDIPPSWLSSQEGSPGRTQAQTVDHSGPESPSSSSHAPASGRILPGRRAMTPAERFLADFAPSHVDEIREQRQENTGNRPEAGSSNTSGHKPTSVRVRKGRKARQGEHTDRIHPGPKG